MRISDWSSDVCSSDLDHNLPPTTRRLALRQSAHTLGNQGRATIDKPRVQLHGIGARLDFLQSLVARRDPAHAENSHGIAKKTEERRVGKECVSTCSVWWTPDLYITKKKNTKKR